MNIEKPVIVKSIAGIAALVLAFAFGRDFRFPMSGAKLDAAEASAYVNQAAPLAVKMKNAGRNLAQHAVDFVKVRYPGPSEDKISRDIAKAKLGFAYKERLGSKDYALSLANEIKALPDPPENAKEAHRQLIDAAVTLRDMCIVGQWNLSNMPSDASLTELADTYKKFKDSMSRFDLVLPKAD